MNKTALRLALSLMLVVAYGQRLLADVSVTEPTGGENISADKAANSTNGAGYTSLGSIVITEGDPADFEPGNNQTLILTLPYGWRFNTAASANVTLSHFTDFTSASVAVSASTVTLTFSVSGTAQNDSISINGLQVQPLEGGADNY